MKSLYRYLLDRFHVDIETRNQAELIVNFTVIEALFSFLFLILHPYFNFHVPRVLFGAFGVSVLSVLFLFRTSATLVFIAHATIAMMWIGFTIACAFSGGIYSVVLPWLALMPITANLLIHHQAARFWAALSALSIFAFLMVFKNPLVMQDDKAEWRSLIANLGLVSIVFLFSFLFQRAKNKLLNTLKEKNAELAENQEELEAQNSILLEQHDHIARQNTLLQNQKEELEKANGLLREKVDEILTRNTLLEKYWHELLEISKSKPINFGTIDDAMRHIIKVAADCLKTDRVSIWRYNEERNTLQCLILYQPDQDKYSIEEELLGTNFPRYFEALRKEDVIPADDAEKDQHTFEFRRDYLQPNHIVSMMDTPFFLDGKLGGVLCCEHREHRHWLPEDIIFAQALSDIVTLAFRATQRRQYEANVRQHKKEITRINFSLEEKIRERTAELESQNQQLAEYAFINSHLLRGPLCRILGLINLIDYTDIHTKEMELINHLKLSGNELDDVITRINGAIERGDHFNRIYLNKSN